MASARRPARREAEAHYEGAAGHQGLAAVCRRYLFVVALADYGYIYAAYRGLSHDYFVDVAA